jgi:hypothetical protein
MHRESKPAGVSLVPPEKRPRTKDDDETIGIDAKHVQGVSPYPLLKSNLLSTEADTPTRFPPSCHPVSRC